eukprot:TRINITY_DN29591_c0_g1_i1.p2 TRINITY_DN29591_c0_g1~~TRINITY_DN29591_c0_g1_i1.p2  ORF type:complete len:140 (+),score=34.89 TRINITY_DN29591_c0_g1_i1:133-552(+)
MEEKKGETKKAPRRSVSFSAEKFEKGPNDDLRRTTSLDTPAPPKVDPITGMPLIDEGGPMEDGGRLSIRSRLPSLDVPAPPVTPPSAMLEEPGEGGEGEEELMGMRAEYLGARSGTPAATLGRSFAKDDEGDEDGDAPP